ncbi:MAG: type II toxin-antitoxin system VapC family toxin [Cyanobium sp.]
MAFLNASAVIDAVEGEAVWAEAVKRQLRQLAATAHASGGVLRLAVSRLSWLECRVGPLRRRDASALERFEGFFSRPDLQWVGLTAAVVEQATLLRADHLLRTPDALQAACCQQLGPTAVMVTGDVAFQKMPGLAVAMVQAGSPAAA